MGKEGRDRSRSRDRRGGGEKRERVEEDKRSRRKSSAQEEGSPGDRKSRKAAKETAKEPKEVKETKEVKSSKEVKTSKEMKDSKDSRKESHRESRKEPKPDPRKEPAKGSKKEESRDAAAKDASRKEKGKKEAKADVRSKREPHGAGVENGGKAAHSDDDAEALRLAAASAAASASVKERHKEGKEPNGKERRVAEEEGTPKAKKRKTEKKEATPPPAVAEEPAPAPAPEPVAPAKQPEVRAPVVPAAAPAEAPEEERLPLHVRSLDSPVPSGAGRGGSSSGSAGSSYSGSGSDEEGGRRKGKVRKNLRGASGFGLTQTQSAGRGAIGVLGIPSPPREAGPAMYGPSFPSSALALLPEKVRGIVDKQKNLSEELMKLKQSAEARGGTKESAKEESKETMLRMPPRLHEALLHPENEPKLLARTGLAAACLNEDGLVVLRGYSRKGLMKALGQLRRVAYHCQWGCSQAKVSALLSERPSKPVNTMVVRLAATSSKLQSFEVRLTNKVRKLRIGTQSGACQLVVEGIPGLSRKHCTITLEPEKGACYVQDLSTNGTYLNGKRLPRPPYKNLQDARVRLFHGDELFFRLRSEEAEELGYVVNLLELS